MFRQPRPTGTAIGILAFAATLGANNALSSPPQRKTWMAGETLKAEDLNSALDALEHEIGSQLSLGVVNVDGALNIESTGKPWAQSSTFTPGDVVLNNGGQSGPHLVFATDDNTNVTLTADGNGLAVLADYDPTKPADIAIAFDRQGRIRWRTTGSGPVAGRVKLQAGTAVVKTAALRSTTFYQLTHCDLQGDAGTLVVSSVQSPNELDGSFTITSYIVDRTTGASVVASDNSTICWQISN